MVTTLSNSILSVTIKHKGAELQSLIKTTTKREYIWEGNPEYWGKHSPILFPIVGTLKNNFYSYNGNSYTLFRHGFARDMEFSLLTKKDNKVTFSLQFDGTTLSFYPFKFELQVHYSLILNRLDITYTVINKDLVVMPYSIGGHPAFALPESFENYSLLFESNENLISYQLQDDLVSATTNTILLNGNELSLFYSLFEKDALIFKTMASKQIQLLENGDSLLNFEFSDFKNFGIWSKSGAPFICLEPWVGYSDTSDSNGEIMEKEAIQLLAVNAAKNYRFAITIF